MTNEKTYLMNATRESLIQWLINNDPNGCYSDEQSKNEGLSPLTQKEALEIALNQLKD